MNKKSINWHKVFDYGSLIAIPILGILLGLFVTSDMQLKNVLPTCAICTEIMFLIVVVFGSIIDFCYFTWKNREELSAEWKNTSDKKQ